MRVEQLWEIEDEAGVQIVPPKPPKPPKRPRWRVLALAALLLGFAISWFYCPALSAVPAPVSTPAPLPPVETAVDLESQAPVGGNPFNRFRDGDWIPTRPDPSLLTNTQGFDTVHFRVEFPLGQGEMARSIAAQFERAYLRLCLDMGCRTGSGDYRDDVYGYSAFPRVLNITLRLRRDAKRSIAIGQGQWLTFTLALGAPAPSRTDPEIERFAYDSLIAPIARMASGGRARWQKRNDGELFLNAVAEWERDRLRLQPTNRAPFTQTVRSLAGAGLPPLAALWGWPIQFPAGGALLARLRSQAQSMIAFIEQEFGPARVAALIRAFEQAQSLPEAVESGLGMDYEVFESQWRAWLDRSE